MNPVDWIKTRTGLAVVFIVVAAVVLLINTASVRDGAENAEASADQAALAVTEAKAAAFQAALAVKEAANAADSSERAVQQLTSIAANNATVLQAIEDKSETQTLVILRTTLSANFCAVLIRPQSETQFADFLNCLDRVAAFAENFNPTPLGEG